MVLKFWFVDVNLNSEPVAQNAPKLLSFCWFFFMVFKTSNEPHETHRSPVERSPVKRSPVDRSPVLLPPGNCSAGYYCPQGQVAAAPFPCPAGHYCPEHTFDPILCPSGFYQSQPGMSECDLCPSGYYCDNTLGVVVVNDTVICPAGYFCPQGENCVTYWGFGPWAQTKSSQL